ncbi:MAG: hypothetical protein PGN26_10615 [Xylophilus ampelinus]
MPSADPAPHRPRWLTALGLVLAAAVVLSVVGSLLIAYRLSPRPSTVEPTAQDAREACRSAARKLLLDPKRAEWLDMAQWRATSDGSGAWTVILRYRLTNKSGDSREGTAACMIQHDRATDEWRLLDMVES